MSSLVSLLNEGKKKEAWKKYCGFIDLSLEEFMKVQDRLLREQIELLSRTIIGQKFFGNNLPKGTEEFRKYVSLTTYEDYMPLFSEKPDNLLPEKPLHWICTSGKSGAYDHKWAPYSQGMFETHAKNFLASIIFSLCSKRGEFSLHENFKFLYAMAPPPYLTGMVPYGLEDLFPFEYLPALPLAEKMSFEERNREGFRQGLTSGIDLFFGVSSILTRIGEEFASTKSDSLMSHLLDPRALARLSLGRIKSSLQNRKLLSRDIWNLKGIICSGTDTSYYKERIEYYWGKKPLEIYGGTEIGIAATQTWDYDGMTLFPNANFWEFIPEEEFYKSKDNPHSKPATVLINELQAGKRYELVITNLKGGAFVRYRLGDMIKVLRLTNEKLDIELPQILYEDRIDDIIDLAGFTRITERTLWEALKQAGITQSNWLAGKAFSDTHPIIELYLGFPKEIGQMELMRIEERIHQALKIVDTDYADLQEMLDYRPLKLKLVSEETLRVLLKTKGTMLSSRINPSTTILKELVG